MISDFITMQHDQHRPEAFLQSGQSFGGSHGGAGLVQKGMHFEETTTSFAATSSSNERLDVAGSSATQSLPS
jgi:hypothetical protein